MNSARRYLLVTGRQFGGVALLVIEGHYAFRSEK